MKRDDRRVCCAAHTKSCPLDTLPSSGELGLMFSAADSNTTPTRTQAQFPHLCSVRKPGSVVQPRDLRSTQDIVSLRNDSIDLRDRDELTLTITQCHHQWPVTERYFFHVLYTDFVCEFFLTKSFQAVINFNKQSIN